ncbi:hypothetical protein D0T49_03900 [Paludibacter sp. 221]|uniref:hypothetical protein n=1 Tax=Paludibacter sp. 221 TaxID=2302939 RepID=UPI0013D76C45|nr:hypothetical protein [Paludibacter sp. 221]NDV46184.1 hypothetical protein [Paludibacter sp. 221]
MKENTEEQKKDERPILSSMSVKDAVYRCGMLQLDFEDICLLLAEKTNPEQLMAELQDPESEPYQWYHQGVAEGKLKLAIDLEYNVGDPKAKDAYKNLSAERRREAVNKKLKDLFGL